MKGERKFEAEEKEENFQRIERRFGSFVRSSRCRTRSTWRTWKRLRCDGVLSIRLKKKPEAKPKQIQVKVGAGAQASNSKQMEAQAA